ncbi:transposase [Salinarimonas ramus]|uniref:Insertion element IS402-like domain-containing protein n=1 Tax=Salinarimonas ramus TaxID=690164 RepID=A0A917QF08_9HYPH|nr:transposase [Salinarimonas ramus]GGK47686.1 hypothetical protein GCM10011322_38410 [Salinarimonas ramus]
MKQSPIDPEISTAIARFADAVDVLHREADGMSLAGASVLLQVLAAHCRGRPVTIAGIAASMGMTYSAVRKHIEQLRSPDDPRHAWIVALEPVGNGRTLHLGPSDKARRIADAIHASLDGRAHDVLPPRRERQTRIEEPQFLHPMFRPETGPGPGDAMTDQEWAHLEPILLDYVKVGPNTDLREIIDAYVFKITTAASWSALPARFPPRSTIWSIINPRDGPHVRWVVDRLVEPLVEQRCSMIPEGMRPRVKAFRPRR